MTSTSNVGGEASAVAADAGAGTVADTGSGARRIAFRALAWVTALGLVALSVFGLMEVILMWLPDARLLVLIDDLSAADLSHRGHFNSIGIVSWALVLAVVVQLRKPQRRAAAMLLAVAMVLAGTVLYGLSGSLTESLIEEVPLLVLILLLAWLHPRAGELVRRPRLDRNMAGLVALAVVPWLVFAFAEAQLQWRNVAADSHAAMEHWATSALMAVTMVVAGLIGSMDHTGWRLPAWIAALASIDYGLHSLAFPDVASSASTPWAVAAIVWGCVYAVAIIDRSRRFRPAELVS